MENRLFETEILLARSRGGQPTRFWGCCFWKPMEGELTTTEAGELGNTEGSDCSKYSLVELLQNSQWGGQRNQGMGAIAKVEEKDSLGAAVDPFFQEMESTKKFPRLTLAPKQRGLFYLRYPEESEKEGGKEHIQGRLMPLTGRRHSDKGPGLAAEPVTVVWDVGWRLRHVPDAGAGITIDLSDRRYACQVEGS